MRDPVHIRKMKNREEWLGEGLAVHMISLWNWKLVIPVIFPEPTWHAVNRVFLSPSDILTIRLRNWLIVLLFWVWVLDANPTLAGRSVGKCPEEHSASAHLSWIARAGVWGQDLWPGVTQWSQKLQITGFRPVLPFTQQTPPTLGVWALTALKTEPCFPDWENRILPYRLERTWSEFTRRLVTFRI